MESAEAPQGLNMLVFGAVWAADCEGKAAICPVHHQLSPAHWLTWWVGCSKMAEWRQREMEEGWMMEECKNRKSTVNRMSFPPVDHFL